MKHKFIKLTTINDEEIWVYPPNIHFKRDDSYTTIFDSIIRDNWLAQETPEQIMQLMEESYCIDRRLFNKAVKLIEEA
jgi:hypothetical protein